MSSIRIFQQGITDIGTEAIVNAANEDLWMGGGVCGVLFRAAGAEDLSQACGQYGHCDTGNAVITPGFRLCRYIIHAVGPIYQGGIYNEKELLYQAYYNSLLRAKENQVSSIGFPLISAGIFGYPIKEAWQTAISACRDFIQTEAEYDIEIRFAIIDNRIYQVGCSILNSIEKQDDLTEFHFEKTGIPVK